MQALLTMAGTIGTILGGIWMFDMAGQRDTVELIVRNVLGLFS